MYFTLEFSTHEIIQNVEFLSYCCEDPFTLVKETEEEDQVRVESGRDRVYKNKNEKGTDPKKILRVLSDS